MLAETAVAAVVVDDRPLAGVELLAPLLPVALDRVDAAGAVRLVVRTRELPPGRSRSASASATAAAECVLSTRVALVSVPFFLGAAGAAAMICLRGRWCADKLDLTRTRAVVARDGLTSRREETPTASLTHDN